MRVLVVGVFVLHLFVFLLGLALVIVGFRWFRLGWVIRNTPPAKPGSVAVGRAEVEGYARPVDEPIEAPITGEECLYLEWTLAESVDGEWVDRAADSRIEPFALEGENGSVIVRADKHPSPEELPWEYDSEQFTGPPDGAVRDLLTSHSVDDSDAVNPATTTDPSVTVDPSARSGGEDREWLFTKRLLPPGTPLYVFGAIEPQHDMSAVGFESDPTTGQFIVERSSERHLADRTYALGLLAFGAGMVFLLWGGLALVGQAPHLV